MPFNVINTDHTTTEISKVNHNVLRFSWKVWSVLINNDIEVDINIQISKQCCKLLTIYWHNSIYTTHTNTIHQHTDSTKIHSVVNYWGEGEFANFKKSFLRPDLKAKTITFLWNTTHDEFRSRWICQECLLFFNIVKNMIFWIYL